MFAAGVEFIRRRLLMLSVVLLAGDPAALPVLRALDSGALPLRHRPIGERPVFHLLHVRLALLDPRGLPLVQLAGHYPLIDPAFLILLPLVDAWRALRLRQRGPRDRGQRRTR